MDNDIKIVESQKNSFLGYEADSWFERNKEVILNYRGDLDKVIQLIEEYSIDVHGILEIGCSAGYRLNALKQKFPKSEVFGIEPSKRAIEYGKNNFLGVNFINGTADDLSMFENQSLDVVIVGFVFYVIDRNILFKVISEIDRVLKNGGILIIVDFFSEATLKNIYHHIDEFQAFSFKQNYDDIFLASKMYYLLDKSTFSHTTKTFDATSNYYDKYSITLLKKDFYSSYK
ncbi:MAG: class I SAM-dependent methyltransferase [Limnohabitans sp.]|nr:class I SAM-dependent methyltransferase [Limnohabitans sp.]